MDSTQLLLAVVLTVSTILLIVVGLQLIFVLQELRKVLNKINAIVEGFEKVGVSLEHGLGEMYGFVTGMKALFKFIDILHAKKNGKTK